MLTTRCHSVIPATLKQKKSQLYLCRLFLKMKSTAQQTNTPQTHIFYIWDSHGSHGPRLPVSNIITFESVDVLVGGPVELEGISIVRVLPREEEQPGVSRRVVKIHLV